MYEIFEKLLQKHGVTTYQVSKVTGITQSTFSNWKSRRNLISAENGKKIAEYFKVSLDYLMGNSSVKEMGRAIKEERESQGVSRAELATESAISVESLEEYEADYESIREDIYIDILNNLGTTHFELLDKYGLYDEYIPAHFDGDIEKYEAFKNAVDKDAMTENLADIIAKNETERRLLMLARKAGDVSEDEREAILNNFESTIDMYLRAKGIKKE